MRASGGGGAGKPQGRDTGEIERKGADGLWGGKERGGRNVESRGIGEGGAEGGSARSRGLTSRRGEGKGKGPVSLPEAGGQGASHNRDEDPGGRRDEAEQRLADGFHLLYVGGDQVEDLATRLGVAARRGEKQGFTVHGRDEDGPETEPCKHFRQPQGNAEALG